MFDIVDDTYVYNRFYGLIYRKVIRDIIKNDEVIGKEQILVGLDENRFCLEVHNTPVTQPSNISNINLVKDSEHSTIQSNENEVPVDMKTNKILLPLFSKCYNYDIVYVKNKISLLGIKANLVVFDYENLEADFLNICKNIKAGIILVIKFSQLIAEQFLLFIDIVRKRNYKFYKVIIELDYGEDASRVLKFDITYITNNLVVVGSVVNYLEVDPIKKFKPKVGYGVTNPIEFDRINRNVIDDSLSVTFLVNIDYIDFLDDYKGTYINGIIVPTLLFNKLKSEGNLITFDGGLLDYKYEDKSCVTFPTRYDIDNNFRNDIPDIILTNVNFGIDIIFNLLMLDLYKLEYRNLVDKLKYVKE